MPSCQILCQLIRSVVVEEVLTNERNIDCILLHANILPYEIKMTNCIQVLSL